MASVQGREIRSIQVLRAVAATAVVYSHCNVEDGFGFAYTGDWGVDIFFVISGLIIARMLLGRPGGNRYFLRKRIIRIVPIYWLATLMVAAGALLMPASVNSTELSGPGLLKSLFFVPYEIDGRPGPVLGQGWTLNYEMFFYVVIGLLLLVMRSGRQALLIGGSLLLLAGLSGFIAPADSVVLRFYQSGLLFEFLFGALLWFGYQSREGRRLQDRLGVRGSALSGAVLLVTGLTLLIGRHLVLFTGDGEEWRFLFYGVPALLVVAGGLLLEPVLPQGRTMQALVVIGDASYALYLFHPFLIRIIPRLLFGEEFTAGPTPLRLVVMLLVIAAAIAVSIVIDRAVDAPLRRRLRNWFVPKPAPRIAQ